MAISMENDPLGYGVALIEEAFMKTLQKDGNRTKIPMGKR
jgi:hypothetical protein